MKRLPLLLALTGAALHLSAAEPADEIKAAVAKLEAAPSYAWTTTTEMEGFPFTPGPQSGRANRDGWVLLTTERDGSTATAVLKGTNGVVQTADGWKNASELPQPQFGGGTPPDMSAMMGRMLLNSRPPVAEANQLLGKVTSLKATGAVISGELTPEAAKELASMRRGRRGGGAAPEAKDAKGDVRFWLKDGMLQKYALHTQGTISTPDGQEMAMGRTTTVVFSDVGTAKVEIPDAAKQKLTPK
jgi:hypothetical protein